MPCLRSGPILISVSFLLATVLFGLSAHQPLHLDNMDFPAVAQATSHSWLPVYYRGEENPAHLGLYHPPLYIYCLAAWMKVFRPTPASARYFGFVCLLLHGLIVLQLIRTVFGHGLERRVRAWFWFAFLLSSYTLQTASIADIDSTIYGPILCSILLVAARMMWRDGEARTGEIPAKETGLLTALIMLALWAKLTTVLLVFPILFALFHPYLGLWGAARRTMLVSAGGVGAFLLTYFAYGWLTGLPVMYSFSFTWQSFAEKGSTPGGGWLRWVSDHWGTFRVMVPTVVAWTGLLPWMMLTCGLALMLWRFIKHRDRRAYTWLHLQALCAVTSLYYCAQTMSFGDAPFKYIFVYWGLAVGNMVLFSAGSWWEPHSEHFADQPDSAWPPPGQVVMCAATFLASGLASILFLRDRMILEGLRTATSWSILGPCVFLGVALFCGFARHGALRNSAPRWAAIGLSMYVGIMCGVELHQARVDYATTYDYGQTGFEDTVAFLRQATTADQVISSMKDIGYAAGRRYLENYAAVCIGGESVRTLTDWISSGKIRYAIFTERYGEDQLVKNPKLRNWVSANCRIVRSFGDYRIYEYAGAKAERPTTR